MRVPTKLRPKTFPIAISILTATASVVAAWLAGSARETPRGSPLWRPSAAGEKAPSRSDEIPPVVADPRDRRRARAPANPPGSAPESGSRGAGEEARLGNEHDEEGAVEGAIESLANVEPALRARWTELAIHRGADPAARREAIESLAEMGDLRTVEEVLALEATVEIRRSAIESLGRHGARDAFPCLVELCQRDPAPEVREAALRALSAIDPDAAIPHVAGALAPGSPSIVRRAALTLLTRSPGPESLALAHAIDPDTRHPEEAADQAVALWALEAARPEAAAGTPIPPHP